MNLRKIQKLFLEQLKILPYILENRLQMKLIFLFIIKYENLLPRDASIENNKIRSNSHNPELRLFSILKYTLNPKLISMKEETKLKTMTTKISYPETIDV